MTSSSKAELKCPAIFGEHMVLQQGTTSIWGWAKAGKTINVSIAGQNASALVGSDGKWKVSLAGLKAGGPFELSVSGDGALTYSDVLVGDVWLGSGQSNMEFLLNNSREALGEISKADFPQIRLFAVDHASSLVLKEDVKGAWKVCSPETAKDFSAVAYYFGKGLYQNLKKPIGLITASWGGSPAEDWVPRPALDKEPEFVPLLKDWDKDEDRTAAWTDGLPYELLMSDIRLVPKAGKGKVLTVDLKGGAGDKVGTWNLNVVTGSTGTFLPGGTGPKGGPAAVLSGLEKGSCWITLSTPIQAGSGTMDLTPYDAIELYIKGKNKYRFKLGQASISDYNYYSTDIIEAPADWKLLRFPISSFKQGEWGTPKPFTPETIQSLILNPEIPYSPEVASVAFNGMIAPLTSFNIKGVLWYQGEANWARSAQYQKMLSTLIASWREAWGIDFPFLIIQLPNFMAVANQPTDTAWAGLREAQRMTAQTIPNTGLVTTIDLGEADNIHPKNKKDVGDRLTRLALGMVYGEEASYTSPVFEKAMVKGSAMVVSFKNVGGGLALKPGVSGAVTGFALAGPGGVFHWADAKIVKRDTVEVTCVDIQEPQAVRYAWADNPVCNLASKDGFPAAPFQFSFPLKPGAKNEADDIPPPP